MLERGEERQLQAEERQARGEDRQLQGAGQEGGEARAEESLQRGQRGLEQILGSADPHTWDQSNPAFHHQDVWSDALCRMQTSLALHL